MLLVRSKSTTDFHIGWQSGAELTNQLRDADYGSKNDWCLVSRMSYATKKQRKFKSLLMYCSIGLPTITADKLARVHSQSCTSHGPQVVQRKQKWCKSTQVMRRARTRAGRRTPECCCMFSYLCQNSHHDQLVTAGTRHCRTR